MLDNVSRKETRVILICMLDSIHTARWLKNFIDQDVDFILFPSTPNRRVHPLIEDLLSGKSTNLSTFTLRRAHGWLSIPMWGIDQLVDNRLRGWIVSRMIRGYEATHIHAMELNNAGRILTRATGTKTFTKQKTICTVWGSDIFWFGRFSRNRKHLSRTLRKTDLLISECNRDFDAAKKLGFGGEFVKSESLFGFSNEIVDKNRIKASDRSIVLVKGYESFVGRASIAIEAIQVLEKELMSFHVIAYSTTWRSRKMIRKHNKISDVKIEYFRKHSLTSAEMIQLFEKARVHVGISLSDGVPASMLEAMVTGAFPIQSNTACHEGWIVDKESCLLVSPEISEVVSAIRVALIEDDLVNSAMNINQVTAKSRLTQEKVSERILGMNIYT